MGHKALSKVQFGQETVQGTAVAADFIWRGPFAGLKDARTTESVDEQLGIALKSSRKFAAQLMAEFSQPVTNFTPEQAPHVFEAGIKQVNTGVADGAGSTGFKYSYPFGTTSINSVSTYTIETGDESQAEEAEFCFVKSFTITAVKGQAVQISAEWAGRTVADTTFTPALSAPAVTEVHASAGSIWIDNAAGTFGTTAIASGNIMEMTFEVTTGLVPLFTIDSGQLYFQGIHFNVDEFEASMELKWIHDTAAVTEKGLWRTNTDRLIRVEFDGEAYATPGSGTDLDGVKGLRIDFPCSYDEFSAIEFDEGKSIVTASASGGYENAGADGLALYVYNEDATLT
jgi:hypothetical protein